MINMKNKIFYSSNEIPFLFKNFIKTEVLELENYTEEEVLMWANKYNLDSTSIVQWVSPLKWIANRYNLSASEWDTAKDIPDNEMNVYEYSTENGFIIKESDDGDKGYLYVFTPKEGEIIYI